MKAVGRMIIGIGSVCIWLYASFFALKWFGHIADGTITYSGMTAAVAVPLLSGLALLGAVASVILLILTTYGKVKPFWQPVMLFLGILLWLLIQGD
jgi:hypothetical protein